MVQQKFWEASGDYRLVTYSDAKWNVELADSALKLVLPKNVKRSTPQK
jgi:outer membrane lipoprotein-sorting protein